MRKDCCNCLNAVHMLYRIRKERGVTLRQMGSTSSGLSLVSTLESNDSARASSVCSVHHTTLGPGWEFRGATLRVRSDSAPSRAAHCQAPPRSRACAGGPRRFHSRGRLAPPAGEGRRCVPLALRAACVAAARFSASRCQWPPAAVGPARVQRTDAQRTDAQHRAREPAEGQSARRDNSAVL